MEIVRDFIFLDSKITAGDDCNLEIKTEQKPTNQPTNKQKHLLLWRKAMTNLHSIFKNRNITFMTKVLVSYILFQ